MSKRLELHDILCDILGSREAYFQPPESVRMTYPAIVYSRSGLPNTFADNIVYKQDEAYEIIVIDKDPDSKLVEKISKLPKCSWIRNYKSDGLNHDVFNLYY